MTITVMLDHYNLKMRFGQSFFLYFMGNNPNIPYGRAAMCLSLQPHDVDGFSFSITRRYSSVPGT